MEYVPHLIVLATMGMVASVVLIIGRTLGKA